MDQSILPNHFEGDPKIILAVLLMIAGFMTIFMLEKFAKKFSN
jgi:putative membrane protein